MASTEFCEKCQISHDNDLSCDFSDIAFITLPGECVKVAAHTREGRVVMSNYRLHITVPPSFINLPLGLIEAVEQHDLFVMYLFCKDCRFFRVQFGNNNTCEEWTKRIDAAIEPANIPSNVFAFTHYLSAVNENFEECNRRFASSRSLDRCINWFNAEVERLGFDMKTTWRISNINMNHEFCSTYPEQLLMPSCISDETLNKVAKFRSARRIPAVVWRCPRNGAVLCRCSQPEVGILYWRSAEDERLIKAIVDASARDCGGDSGMVFNGWTNGIQTNGIDKGDIDGIDFQCDSVSSSGVLNSHTIPTLKDLSAEVAHHGVGVTKPVLIMDARSFAAAFSNRARGGGVECPEYYANAEVHFMNIANIHSVRKSFQSVRTICNMPMNHTSWFQNLDGTRWLSYISSLLKAATSAANSLENEGRTVIVHCSDGWDRTPQIVSLAQLILDPYYRTFEGFQVLVQKEWLDFGHKMADRCGLTLGCSDTNERSPIFLQWLDCVHQLLIQFPCDFEFNVTFLAKLLYHTYSNLFGTFLCNSISQRKHHKLNSHTRSVWDYLRNYPHKFVNCLYSPGKQTVLWPKSEVRDLELWKDVYVASGSASSILTGSISPPPNSSNAKSASSGCTSSENGSGSRDETEHDHSIPNGTKRKLEETDKSKDISLVREELERLQINTNGVSSSSSLTPSSHSPSPLPPTSPPSLNLVPSSSYIFNNESPEMIAQTNGGSTDTLVFSENMVQSLCRNAVNHIDSTFDCRRDSCCVSSPSCFDSDGLTPFHDPIQSRVMEIMMQRDAEMASLRRDLSRTRLAFSKLSKEHQSNIPSNITNSLLPDDDTRSEISWENIDNGTERTTLWVPDHTTDACMVCENQFWFGRRKHHCRGCGRIICGRCSAQESCIPSEKLYYPVRVCDDCFTRLQSTNQERDSKEAKICNK